MWIGVCNASHVTTTSCAKHYLIDLLGIYSLEYLDCAWVIHTWPIGNTMYANFNKGVEQTQHAYIPVVSSGSLSLLLEYLTSKGGAASSSNIFLPFSACSASEASHGLDMHTMPQPCNINIINNTNQDAAHMIAWRLCSHSAEWAQIGSAPSVSGHKHIVMV